MATITSASAYRQRRAQGEEWTSPSGAVVLVRKFDITDHAVLNHFPDYLKQMIYRTIASSARLKAPTSDEDEGDNPFDGLDGEQVLSRERELGTLMCKLGWVAPAVVDEVSDEETQISVDELDPSDRRAFMAWVFAGYEQEAKQLTTFPDGSTGGLGAVRRVPDVSPAAERPTPPPGAGVFRADGV